MTTPSVCLDSSVVLAWVLPDEPWHAAARGIGADIAAGTLEPLGAPNLRFEVRHGLVRAARRGRVTWSALPVAIDAIEQMAIGTPLVGLDDAALLAVCHKHGLSWGDAHHALVAHHLEVPLLTADVRLARALEGTSIWVESIADRPLD